MLSHSPISMKTMTTFSGTSLIIKNTKGMTRRQNSPSAICLVQKSQILCIYTPTYIYARIYYTNQQQKLLESLHKNTPEYGFIWSGYCRI